MKLALFFVFIIVSANSFAQQEPRAVIVKENPKTMAPPKMAPPVAMAPPHAPESQTSNEELTNLLRAQTTAIKSLSSKLDSLEERISKIEKGQR